MKWLICALTFSTALFAASDWESCLGNLERAYQSKGYRDYVAKLTSFSVTDSTLEYSYQLYVHGALSAEASISKDLNGISNRDDTKEAFETFFKHQQEINLCFRIENNGKEKIEIF